MQELPEEPYLDQLMGDDAMDFPSPPGPPLEHQSVIPAYVIDALLDASDEVAMASVPNVSRRW